MNQRQMPLIWKKLHQKKVLTFIILLVDFFPDLIFNHLNKIAKKELKKEKLEKERKEAEAKAAEKAAEEAANEAKSLQNATP